ncbi:MAG: phosphoribosylanthranilate isomerase [Thermoleophilia bacterium]
MARVKICGLTNPGDAMRAVAAGAWAVGVIFAPESPRRVTRQQAAAIMAAVPPGILKVGVFVNAGEEEITAAVRECGLGAVQLHGEESPAFCRRIGEITGAAVIKAVRVAGRETLGSVASFDTDFILLDTYQPGRRGGTGESFDWNIARELSENLRSGRVILSGGLGAENVIEALDAVGPYAVDVSSGIETAPGVKDPGEMERLFDILGQMKP